MRNMFRAYYRPTTDEVTSMWSSGILILDTNALLNLFRYSSGAREDFFKALAAKSDSVWIPHQVGLEFHRNRISTVNQQNKAFSDIESALGKARDAADAAFNTYKRHPSLDIKPLRDGFASAIDGLISTLQSSQNRHDIDMVAASTNDGILEEITKLFEGKVGEPFDAEALTALYKEGADRYEKSVPPGFKDASKPEPGRYGDLVLWKQILQHAGAVNKPAIFVTDDQKEDWWYTVDSFRHGPRPELVEEYFVASGERIHFMTTDRFLEFARSQIDGIRSESITELEDLTKEQARLQTSREARGLYPFESKVWERLAFQRSHQNSTDRLAQLEQYAPYVTARNELDQTQRLISLSEAQLQLALNRLAFDADNPALAQEVEERQTDIDLVRAHVEIVQRRLNKAVHEFDYEHPGGRSGSPRSHRGPHRIGDFVDEALGMPPLDLEWDDDSPGSSRPTL